MQEKEKEIDFFKFPSTPYLIMPKDGMTRHDKVLSHIDAEFFFTNEVIVEEKIDGANLGISFSHEGDLLLQNRGDYLVKPYKEQWAPIEKWIKGKESSFFDVLFDKYILFGEWCYLTHSVFYNSLPDWFIAFDVYDKIEKCFLSVEQRNAIAKQIRISTVPFIAKERITIDSLDKYIGHSAFGDQICEGIYLRIDSETQLLKRAKYVRNTFSQSIEKHWSKQKHRKNQIITKL